MDYVTIFKEILNLKGPPNRINGSRVTPILLNGWVFPIGGVSAVKGLRILITGSWSKENFKLGIPFKSTHFLK